MCFLNINALHHYWWSTGVPAGALCVECNFIAIGVCSPLQVESSSVESSQIVGEISQDSFYDPRYTQAAGRKLMSSH